MDRQKLNHRTRAKEVVYKAPVGADNLRGLTNVQTSLDVLDDKKATKAALLDLETRYLLLLKNYIVTFNRVPSGLEKDAVRALQS